MALQITNRDIDERTTVVALAGEIDLASAPDVKWALVDLASAGRDRIVVDMSAVSFIDSTGLGVLVGFKKTLGADARFVIACVPPAAHKAFEVAGLGEAFTMLPTVDDALAYALEPTGGA